MKDALDNCACIRCTQFTPVVKAIHAVRACRGNISEFTVHAIAPIPVFSCERSVTSKKQRERERANTWTEETEVQCHRCHDNPSVL